MFILDTHAHYDDERFLPQLDKLVSDMRSNGVCGIITCGTDYESSAFSVELASRYDIMYAAVGIYPHDIVKVGEFDKERLCRLLSDKKAVAVGEIGLDYYYDDTPKQIQLEWIEKLLQLSKEVGKPISFHDRDAHDDTLRLMKKYRPSGVIHCFSGSAEMAKEIVRLGMYIGVGGVLTFKNAKKLVNVCKEIPLQKIVLETDAPYMAPEPVRGTLNRSDYIHYIAEKLAEVKGESVETVREVTTENAKRVFGL